MLRQIEARGDVNTFSYLKHIRYVLITCFHDSWNYKSWIFYLLLPVKKMVFWKKKITVILAFFNLFWFLNQNKQQISWKKFRFCIFRIRENMWWTRYRAQRAHLVQTEEQYIFIHDALVEVIEAGETHINKTALPRYIHSLQCIDVTDEKNHPPKVLEKQHKVCFFLVIYNNRKIREFLAWYFASK